MQYPIEPFIVSGEGVLTPPGRDRWVTSHMFKLAGSRPTFTTKEAAHCFFGRSSPWLRKKLVDLRGNFDVDRTDSNHRAFGLHEIEDLAHLMLERGSISPMEFAMVVRTIKSRAILALYEIGDTGFLVRHWNDALPQRRQIITRVMDALESFDGGRAYTDLVRQPELEKAVIEAALSIAHAERLEKPDDRRR